nr:hypothetical protein [Propionibacterium sp.]
MLRKKIATAALGVFAATGLMLQAAPTPANAWLASGVHTQYPATGGIWQYGFWNAAVRSYYTVNRNHGSTVVVEGQTVRSVCTAAGRTSIAEKFALNWWGATDAYYYRTC